MINEHLVRLDLKAKDKVDIITELSNLAYSLGKIKSIKGYVDAVIERENQFSTAVGYSIAIPHGKSDEVIEPFVVFGRVKEQVEWDNDCNKEVKLIFLIGVPPGKSGDVHLKVLANISRQLMNDEFRNTLLTASSVRDVCTMFEAIVI